jgi:uncharacterized membrane protein YphA (DoxX/SURF4 family)
VLFPTTEGNLNSRPYTIGLLSVVLMMALRVVIGWHFFQEGLAHKNDPKWSSEGFLRQAKGPLADQYKQRLPSFHKWDVLILAPAAPEKHHDDSIAAGGAPAEGGDEAAAKNKDAAKPENSPVYGLWYAEAVRDWNTRRDEIASFYKFADEQKQASEKVLDKYADRLAKSLAGYEADIVAYRHALTRNQELAAQPGAEDIPNRNARLTKRSANPTGEPDITVSSGPSDWRSDAEALERSFAHDVAALATADQLKAGPISDSPTEVKKIDTVVIWALIIGGACLVVGLFTRLSAVVLALFLGSVIASQPPWVAGALTTVFNYQAVEFVALLVLASSRVGRWGGLDFFIHHLILRPFRSTQ